MQRDELHGLVDRIPDADVAVALGFLEFLAAGPAFRAALKAPLDDEPVTEADEAAMKRARAERATDRVSHAEILEEFGLK